MKESVLDNPIWHSLTYTHAPLALGDELAKRFPPSFSPLAALRDMSAAAVESLWRVLGAGGSCGLFLPSALPASFPRVVSTEPLLQMVHSDGGQPVSTDADIVELGTADVSDMENLAAICKPGPFASQTIELGRYIGIRQGGVLVAMAGERLHPPGYTEVSAVSTLPEYRGRGYSAALVGRLVGGILARSERPFLHVRSDNESAIRLYGTLGFAARVELRLVRLGSRDEFQSR